MSGTLCKQTDYEDETGCVVKATYLAFVPRTEEYNKR